jgi:twitching motility protein PilT
MQLSELDFTDLYLEAAVEASRIRGGGFGRTLTPVPQEWAPELRRLFQAVDAQARNAPSMRDFSVPYEDVMYRVAVIDDVRHRVYALRRGAADVPPLDACGLSSAVAQWILARKHGLILVAGGFGTGKTTTVSSLARQFAFDGALVVTLEDPPELPLSGDHGAGRILQVQVDRRNIDQEIQQTLRMAFDVLFVSEIRTPTMATEVITASTNGQLILSTIHADSAVNAVSRIATLAAGGDARAGHGNEKVVREMLGSGLVAVIYMTKVGESQRAPSEYLLGGSDVRAKIGAGEYAGLQNAVNMLRNRIAMKLPVIEERR